MCKIIDKLNELLLALQECKEINERITTSHGYKEYKEEENNEKDREIIRTV